MTVSVSNIIEVIGLVVSLLGMALFIRGQVGKLVTSVETLRVQVCAMGDRLDEVTAAAKASHRRLDDLEKDVVRVQVLQEQQRIN